MAGELLMGISKDERERAVYRRRRMYQTDLDSNLATERDNGIKIGIEIGEKRGIEIGYMKTKLEIAEKMLAINIPYEQVVVTTGLPVDTVKELMHKHRY